MVIGELLKSAQLASAHRGNVVDVLVAAAAKSDLVVALHVLPVDTARHCDANAVEDVIFGVGFFHCLV